MRARKADAVPPNIRSGLKIVLLACRVTVPENFDPSQIWMTFSGARIARPHFTVSSKGAKATTVSNVKRVETGGQRRELARTVTVDALKK